MATTPTGITHMRAGTAASREYNPRIRKEFFLHVNQGLLNEGDKETIDICTYFMH